MASSILPFGAQIASDLHDSSTEGAPEVPNTLDDLMHQLEVNPPPTLPMLRTTSSLLVAFMDKAAEKITIESIHEVRDAFRAYLVTRKYAKNSIRTYVNCVRILLNSATASGWNPTEAVPEEWRGVLALAEEMKCADIVRYLARVRAVPEEVTIPDVDRWVEMRIRQGRSYGWAVGRKRSFWFLLRDCGRTSQTPNCILRERTYSVPLEQFPPALKLEVLALLKWKQAVYAPDRPTQGRQRAITAKTLERVICRVFGFARNIQGRAEINSLSALIQKPIIAAYAEYCINERGLKGQSLQVSLGLLIGAVRHHSSYTSLNLAWFRPLLESLPADGESELKKRKAEKYLEYRVVESIPAQIRAGRAAAEKKGIVRLAQLAMEELLMKWIITLPWRQRNIRECRIGGPTPNLFKERIPPFSDIEKPEWVKQEEEKNPAAKFWQFRFSADETKTGHEVDALLPRQLIGILDEYLEDFRPQLLRGVDPWTLFVGKKGKPVTIDKMVKLVGNLTLKHGGRRVTPHLFRDIIAYTWLKGHPKDYLTLSKMLWHSDINTTIRIYGSRFNESSGVCAMESWLDERAASSK